MTTKVQELEDSYYIDPSRKQDGNMIPLNCVNHPHLRWSTKNIGYIGARKVYFEGDSRPITATTGHASECTCPARDLRVVPKAVPA